MRPASLPEELLAECYCPECGGDLAPAKTVDPWAICLSCQAGHRFFVMPEPPHYGEGAEASSAQFPQLKGKGPEAVATFWLTDPAARSMLNEQLAELLRVILEASSVSASLSFSYCPFCGGALTEYEQPDIWVRGLRCPSNHSWAERGGRLSCLLRGFAYRIHTELSDKVARQAVSAWLGGNPHLDPNLHESVRWVLADWMEGKSG